MSYQFNLLPWREEARIKRTKRSKYTLITATVIGLAFSGAYYLYENTRLEDHKSALSTITSANNQLQSKIKKKKALEALKNEFNLQIDAIENLQADRASVTHIIEELSKANNQALFLTNFSLSNEQVNISGIAENDKEISKLMNKLKASDWYQEPKLLNILSKSNLGDEIKSFNITSRLQLSNPKNGSGR